MIGSLISFILVGMLAGWIVGKLSKGSGFGLLGNLIVGVVGAFVGGLLFSLFGLPTGSGFSITSLIVAVIGAFIFLFIANKLKKA